MKINQKTYSILAILFSVVAIWLSILAILNYVSIDVMMLSLGFTELFTGFVQINRALQINLKGTRKGNKSVGILSIILGIVIIITFIVKITA